MTTLLINGVDSETLGFTLAEAPGWLDLPPRQAPTAQVAGRAGARELGDPVEQQRRLTLRGTIRAGTWQNARTSLDNLKLALLVKPLKLTFADHPDRYVVARLESFPTTPPAGALGAFVQENLQCEIGLTAYDPLSYDTSDAGLFLWWVAGDTIPGETFTRAATTNGASYNDANGVVQFAGTNVKRDAHYINGVRHLLVEPASNNFCLQSENFGLVWTVLGTPTRGAAAHVASGITLDLLGDDDAAALERYQQTIAFTSDGVKPISVYVRQGSSASGVLNLFDTTAVASRLVAAITWAGGLPVVATTVGTYLGYETLADGVFRLLFNSTAIVAANSNSMRVYPATDSAFAVGNTGDIYVGGVQCENTSTSGAPSSYIRTGAATVTRALDNYRIPYPYLAQLEITVLAHFVEMGGATSTRVWEVGSGVTPRIIGNRSAAGYLMQHADPSAATATSSCGPTPVRSGAAPDIRHVGRMYLDGSVDCFRSDNGVTPTYSGRTAPLAFSQPTWSAQFFNVGSTNGSSGHGATAFRKIVAVGGIRTFDEMVAMPRLPLGTGPTRPLITLTGVVVNPVFTLLNNAGAVVGTLGLTVTTVATDVLVVDSDAKTITLNGVRHVELLTSGDFFLIDPADSQYQGANGPRITVAGATAATMIVSYHKSWR